MVLRFCNTTPPLRIHAVVGWKWITAVAPAQIHLAREFMQAHVDTLLRRNYFFTKLYAQRFQLFMCSPLNCADENCQ